MANVIQSQKVNPRYGALGNQGGYAPGVDPRKGLFSDPALAQAMNQPLTNATVAPPLNAPGVDTPPEENNVGGALGPMDPSTYAPGSPQNPIHPPAAEQSSPLQAPPIPEAPSVPGSVQYVPGLSAPAIGSTGTPHSGSTAPANPNHPGVGQGLTGDTGGRDFSFEDALQAPSVGQVPQYPEPPTLPQYGGNLADFAAYYGITLPKQAGNAPASTPDATTGLGPGGPGPTNTKGPGTSPAGPGETPNSAGPIPTTTNPKPTGTTITYGPGGGIGGTGAPPGGVGPFIYNDPTKVPGYKDPGLPAHPTFNPGGTVNPPPNNNYPNTNPANYNPGYNPGTQGPQTTGTPGGAGAQPGPYVPPPPPFSGLPPGGTTGTTGPVNGPGGEVPLPKNAGGQRVDMKAPGTGFTAPNGEQGTTNSMGAPGGNMGTSQGIGASTNPVAAQIGNELWRRQMR